MVRSRREPSPAGLLPLLFCCSDVAIVRSLGLLADGDFAAYQLQDLAVEVVAAGSLAPCWLVGAPALRRPPGPDAIGQVREFRPNNAAAAAGKNDNLLRSSRKHLGRNTRGAALVTSVTPRRLLGSGKGPITPPPGGMLFFHPFRLFRGAWFGYIRGVVIRQPEARITHPDAG